MSRYLFMAMMLLSTQIFAANDSNLYVSKASNASRHTNTKGRDCHKSDKKNVLMTREATGSTAATTTATTR